MVERLLTFGSWLLAVGYNVLLTNFLDDRTTAWVLGYFQEDAAAFGA